MAKEAKMIGKQIMVIDPTLQYERKLKYMEKHAAWEMFKTVWWGGYIFIIGMILLVYYKDSPSITISIYSFAGWALTIFALFYILYGLIFSLNLKLMKKYA